VIFVDLDINILIFDHLPTIVVSYDKSLSDYMFNCIFEDQRIPISFASLYEQYTLNKSLDSTLSKVCQHTLFAWIQSSNCFAGVPDSSFEVVRAVTTPNMSKRVDTHSCIAESSDQRIHQFLTHPEHFCKDRLSSKKKVLILQIWVVDVNH